jgi:hypothetical protein
LQRLSWSDAGLFIGSLLSVWDVGVPAAGPGKDAERGRGVDPALPLLVLDSIASAAGSEGDGDEQKDDK